MGWKRRRVQIRTKKPEVHQVVVKTEVATSVHNLSSIVCDGCNTPLGDGTPAWALTEWDTRREGEPGPWENDYSDGGAA